MANIHIKGEKHPDCPLCLQPFKKVMYPTDSFYVCLTDMISINIKDPSILLWVDYKPESKEIPCPNPKCHGEMRFFFRQDGFMKAKCMNKKCQASISSEDIPDRGDFAKKWKIEQSVEEKDNLKKWRKHYDDKD